MLKVHRFSQGIVPVRTVGSDPVRVLNGSWFRQALQRDANVNGRINGPEKKWGLHTHTRSDADDFFLLIRWLMIHVALGLPVFLKPTVAVEVLI